MLGETAAMSPPDARPELPPLRPGREPWGCAAVLLPHHTDGSVDWPSFRSLLERTVAAGLTPAVNMDTGFVQLLSPETRAAVLATTAAVLGGTADPGPSGRPGRPARPDRFLAGAFVADRAGDRFDPDRYRAELAAVQAAGGTPVVFPSHGLNALEPDGWVDAHRGFGADTDRFVAFELGSQFVPYGRIYPLDAYRELLGIGACIGAKHSSLSRAEEWARLVLRDAVRPDFHVFTGNDLAIDMICWGSDYLLGLAAFCPDHFARRDRAWATGDPAFHELNDRLQYLGAFSFRAPVPAYRHDAALFLHHRGWISSPTVPEGAPTRPDSDRDVLALIAADLEAHP
ncbi:MAG TPA: dihydrodipicolinate synthase family protein [Acidimicrobiales bacterium]|nr:dihydrodipicolinate synthase family protein [Acidimicrobiales bacterium]